MVVVSKCAQFLVSPDFFLDTCGCVAKISTSALLDFNADVLILRAPNLQLSFFDGNASRAAPGRAAFGDASLEA